MPQSQASLLAYAAGAFDWYGNPRSAESGPVLASRSTNQDRIQSLQTLSSKFGGSLKTYEGTGKGEGKEFTGWFLQNDELIQFLKEIRKFSSRQDYIDKAFNRLQAAK